MSLRRYLFSGITTIIMIFLLILDVNYLLSYVLALFIIFFGYYIIAVLRNKSRIHLLNEECNPEAFLNRCEKQGRIIGNPHILSSYLAIDMSAGLVCSGEFQSAKYCLEEIDKTKISKAKSALLAYTINLIICCYELGDMEQAERLFETQITILPPLSKGMLHSVKILVGGRYFYLGKYDESYEYFMQLLEDKLSYNKRDYLTILFFLAQIDEIKGNIEAAQVKYKKIADKGNKLWIAGQAAKRLSERMYDII